MRTVIVSATLLLAATPALAARHPLSTNGVTYYDAAAIPAYQPDSPVVFYRHRHHYRHHHVERKVVHHKRASRTNNETRPSRAHPREGATIAHRKPPTAVAGIQPIPTIQPLKPLVDAARAIGALLGIPEGYADGIAMPKPLIVRRRPYHFTGKIEIDGRHYAYGTGGYGRGSIPYGDYPITPDDVGHWGSRHGAIGINHNEIYDPQLHATREGIEIHAAHHLASAGCVAIENYPEAKHSILHMIAEAGAAFLHIWPGMASITPQRSTGLAMVALAEPNIERDDESHNKTSGSKSRNSHRHISSHVHVAHRHHHLVHYAHHHHHYRHYAKA